MRDENKFIGFLKWLLQGVLVLLWLIWKLITGVFNFFKKLVIDVAKNIYGRVVIGLGAIGLAVLASYFLHFLN